MFHTAGCATGALGSLQAGCRMLLIEQFDADALRAHCREVLSPQKTPSVWEQLKEFPLTGSGKIQKSAIRDDYLNRNATEGDDR